MIGVPAAQSRNPFFLLAGGLFLLCGVLALAMRREDLVTGGFLLLVGVGSVAVGLARPRTFGESPESALFGPVDRGAGPLGSALSDVSVPERRIVIGTAGIRRVQPCRPE